MRYYYTLLGLGFTLFLIGLLFKIVRYRLINGYRSSVTSLNQLRKRWQERTNRYSLFRVLNNFFYLVGAGVTIGGFALLVIQTFSPNTNNSSFLIPSSLATQKDNSLDAQKIFELVNQARVEGGLNELRSDPILTKVAEKRAIDMVENQYYAHKNPEGLYFYDILDQEGYSVGFSCENLNIDFTTSEVRYINSWLASTKGHKECLLNSKVDSGGYAVGLFSDPSDGHTISKTYVIVGIHTETPKDEE